MEFSDQPKRRPEESIVPMINVVFLLLIFFLMTAQIAPPEPFDVTRPVATKATDPEADQILYVDQAGRLQFHQALADAAYVELRNNIASSRVLQIKADSRLEASKLAEIITKLTSLGLSRVELVVDVQ